MDEVNFEIYFGKNLRFMFQNSFQIFDETFCDFSQVSDDKGYRVVKESFFQYLQN